MEILEFIKVHHRPKIYLSALKRTLKKSIVSADLFRKEELTFTAQKMKFSINDFFSKCDQIRRFLRIWSHLLNRSLMVNFIFCAVFE